MNLWPFGGDDDGSDEDEERKEEIDELLSKYDRKFEQLSAEAPGRVESREYQAYKEAEEAHRQQNWYEKLVNRIAFFRFDFEDLRGEHERSLALLQYDVEPDQVAPAAVVVGLVALVGAALTLMLNIPSVFHLGAFVVPLVLFYYMLKYPALRAKGKVVQSSESLILAVLYMVIYMRSSPSLEGAMAFAARHLQGPVAEDFKLMLWEVDVREKITIEEALQEYIAVWKPYNEGFVEALSLILSSRSEAEEESRNALLTEAIDQFLTDTQDRMEEFARGLKLPVMLLHGIGILLPVLGIILFPLIATFMGGEGMLLYLGFVYNILLPLIGFAVIKNLLVSRPISFSSESGQLTDAKPGKVTVTALGRSISFSAFFVSVPLFLLMVAWPATHYYGIIASSASFPISPSTVTLLQEMWLMIAVAIPAGLHLILGYRSVLKKQDEVREMEEEFPEALFELGKLLHRGQPIETAIGKVGKAAGTLKITALFDIIGDNIRNQGMTFREAVFDPEMGAINEYPSQLISTIMEIIVQSARKGPQVAARSVDSIADYMKDIQQTQKRLQELLGDTLSSLKFLSFVLAPVIAGIAVGMGSVISISFSVIGGTVNQTGVVNGSAGGGAGGAGAAAGQGLSGGSVGLLSVFNFQNAIPPGLLQLVVGLYLLELSVMIGVLHTRLAEGRNPPRRNHLIGQILIGSIVFYTLTVMVIVMIFGGMIRGVVV
ncbi:MAG: hypothetical protein SVU88_04150 [Candidatus Nanohaloarchaea archaeon]|nr:hypothetical protein [Candidatus Nanohaloarchaea archaeon]